MKSVWVFPGQGAQRKGMGAGLFERYADLVAQADGILGYSLRELCLEDSRGVLDRTEFTQPALFAASALAFLDKRDAGARLPDGYAGHSLGEFNALFAAGAFDFATGIALVAKRGELMSKAPRGAMAAVVGMTLDRVREVLAASGLSGVDVANINSGTQIVIAGLHDDIERCGPVFVAAGARCVRLNVSAAFHSRYMRDVETEFAGFLAGVPLRPLTADVVANCTARLYPREDYAPLITRQISHTVKWYESVSWLLSNGLTTLEEVGPGDVLTNLFVRIRKDPMPTEAFSPSPASDASAPAVTKAARPRVVFMYSGQGSQYYAMGKELYAVNAAFRGAMDASNAIYTRMTGRDMVAELFDESKKWSEMTDIMLSHPALYSIGYGLSVAMEDAGVKPDCVLGYSLGEYVASTVAGVLTHEDAMRIVIRQAMLLKQNAPNGAMRSVIAPLEHFAQHPDVYRGATVASVNFDRNFVVSGTAEALDAVNDKLDALGIVSALLPVEYAFHSPEVESIEDGFRGTVADVVMGTPQLPLYSSATASRLERVDADHYWGVIRNPVDFRAAVKAISEEGDCRFVDLGPTGTLSSFIKYAFGDRFEHHATMNQFGRNAETIGSVVGRLANGGFEKGRL